MDPSFPNQQSQPARAPILPERNRGMFVFWIVTATIVIIFSLTILNYFNILPLSSLFPNQLGFLPHKEVSNGTSQQSQQSNKVTIAPTVSHSVSLLEPAKQKLTSFLPTILTPSFLPKSSSEITLTQTKGIQESFTASWNSISGTESAILIVSPDGKSIAQFYLSFIKSKSASPSVELAKTTTSQFFLTQPKGIWGCKPIYTNMTYCENFWEESNGTRRGIGIEGLFTKGPNLRKEDLPQTMIFFCEHNKDSKLYSWKSCINEFAESGVQ